MRLVYMTVLGVTCLVLPGTFQTRQVHAQEPAKLLLPWDSTWKMRFDTQLDGVLKDPLETLESTMTMTVRNNRIVVTGKPMVAPLGGCSTLLDPVDRRAGIRGVDAVRACADRGVEVGTERGVEAAEAVHRAPDGAGHAEPRPLGNSGSLAVSAAEADGLTDLAG